MQTEIGRAPQSKRMAGHHLRVLRKLRLPGVIAVPEEQGDATFLTGPSTADVGARLADLAPELRTAHCPVEIDVEIGCPRSLVRMDCNAFNDAVLELVAYIAQASAGPILMRSRTRGKRVWLLITAAGDGGRTVGCFPIAEHFARRAHGHLLVRRQPAGTSFALVLPTLLSVAGAMRAFHQPKEKIHEEE